MLSTVSLSNLHFSEVQVTTSLSIFLFSSLQVINISNVTMTSVKTNDNADTTSCLISIGGVDLSTADDYSVSDLVYKNSSIAFLKIGQLTNTPPSSKNWSFNNLAYSDSSFTSEVSLLSLSGLKYNLDIQFTFLTLSFSDISYTIRGYLMELTHQLPTNVTITDISFSNIKNGIVEVLTPDTTDPVIFTTVVITNITVDVVEQEARSFMVLENQATVYISDGRFMNLYSYSDGAVIRGIASKTSTIIENSTFMNNSAQNGGVFSATDESLIKCTGCTITNNAAVSSGVISVALNGYFEFYNSTIAFNIANNNPISQLFDSASISKINNWSLYENDGLTRAELVIEFNVNCSKLWFLSDNYKAYSRINFTPVLNDDAEESLFQLISASLVIENSSIIRNQSAIVNSFVSEVTFDSSTLTDIEFIDIWIQAVVSQLTMTNMNILNLNNLNETDFILALLDSTLTITDLEYSDSNSILFNARTSSVQVDGITFTNIFNATHLGAIASSSDISVNDISSSNSVVTGTDLFLITETNNVSLSNFDIQNSEKLVLKIEKSNLAMYDSMSIRNCTSSLYIRSSTISEMKNSTFAKNGNGNIPLGGAMQISDSSITMKNSTFTENTAISGGAIYFTCSSMALWALNINDTKFESNVALIKGGAIYYDYGRPEFVSSIIFNNNSAKYGPDIASYAVKITFENDTSNDMKINNFGSGIVYEEVLKFAVRDYDNQIMVLDDENQIIISSGNPSISQISGFNSGKNFIFI